MSVAAPFRDAGHLPNLRENRQPPPPEGLPRQRRGTTPQMHGRFPDYDVLEHARHWDDATRRTVLARLEPPGPLRWFTPTEARTLAAFCNVVLAQDAEPRVPVLAAIDARMADRELDGYRYAELPEDPETWRAVARGLDEAAGGSFAAADDATRNAVVERFATGDLHGGTWDHVPAALAWKVVMRSVIATFYAHPWTFNEIGYGGPRYPRGYMRLAANRREPDEGREAFALDPVADVERRTGR